MAATITIFPSSEVASQIHRRMEAGSGVRTQSCQVVIWVWGLESHLAPNTSLRLFFQPLS